MVCVFGRGSPLPEGPVGRSVKKTRVVWDDHGSIHSSVISGNLGEREKKPIHPDQGDRAAAEDARAISSPGLREEMMRRAIQAWAMKDPETALAWAAKLPDPGESQIAMIQVCVQLAESDPASAIRLAMSCHLDEIPGDLLGNFTAGWAARDLSHARDWVDGQPAGEFRDQLMERIVFEYANIDSPAAARLVADRMGSGESQIEAAISVLHQWTLQDLNAATAWVESFPNGTLRDRAARELAGIKAVRLIERGN